VVLRDFTGFPEGLRDLLGVPFGIGGPVMDASGGIDADDAVRADAELPELFRDAAGFLDLGDEVLAFLVAAHGGTAAGWTPDGGNDGADHEAFAPDLVGELLQLVVGRIDTDVRVEKEQVNAIEFLAVDFGFGGAVEHRIEVDARLGARAALADEAGPHGVMQFREIVFGVVFHGTVFHAI
jgi:hypothetical protein